MAKRRREDDSPSPEKRQKIQQIEDDRLDQALVKAVESGNTALVERLLAAGADVNAKDKDGSTALMLAAQTDDDIIWGDDADAIRVSRERSTDIVRRLLAVQGIKVNAQNEDGDTALLNAAYTGHTDIVRLLLAAGADVNAQNEDGDTALLHAAHYEYTDIARLLLAAGADVNAKYKDGDTALMWAAFNGHLDMVIVRLLLAAGADVNAQNEYGSTALMWAAQAGHTDIVDRLLAVQGIDVNAKNKDGDTALTKAAQEGHTAIVNLIRGVIARRRFRGVVRLGRPLRDAKVRAAERVYAPPGAFLDEEGNLSKEGGPGYIEVFNRQMPNFEEGVDE